MFARWPTVFFSHTFAGTWLYISAAIVADIVKNSTFK